MKAVLVLLTYCIWNNYFFLINSDQTHTIVHLNSGKQIEVKKKIKIGQMQTLVCHKFKKCSNIFNMVHYENFYITKVELILFYYNF